MNIKEGTCQQNKREAGLYCHQEAAVLYKEAAVTRRPQYYHKEATTLIGRITQSNPSLSIGESEYRCRGRVLNLYF
jgi:hypothetical protein